MIWLQLHTLNDSALTGNTLIALPLASSSLEDFEVSE